jgi:hypothetical protein
VVELKMTDMKLSLFLIFNSLILEHHFQKFHIFLKRGGASCFLLAKWPFQNWVNL